MVSLFVSNANVQSLLKKNRWKSTLSSPKIHGCANSVENSISTKNGSNLRQLLVSIARNLVKSEKEKLRLHLTNSIKNENVKNVKKKSSLKLTIALVTIA
jgi:hypothetical protein